LPAPRQGWRWRRLSASSMCPDHCLGGLGRRQRRRALRCPPGWRLPHWGPQQCLRRRRRDHSGRGCLHHQIRAVNRRPIRNRRLRWAEETVYSWRRGRNRSPAWASAWASAWAWVSAWGRAGPDMRVSASGTTKFRWDIVRFGRLPVAYQRTPGQPRARRSGRPLLCVLRSSRSVPRATAQRPIVHPVVASLC
jgi:hypothetical protein